MENLVRIKEAAEILGISPWTLRQMAHRKEISFIQRTPKSPLLFSPEDLRHWVDLKKVRKRIEQMMPRDKPFTRTVFDALRKC